MKKSNSLFGKNIKNFTLAFALIAILALGASCSKSDDAVPEKIYEEENPLALYLQGSGFNAATTNFINSGNYEFGYRFSPKVKGKINAITFKIPDNATNTRVTIWDNATKTVLKTITIPTTTANVEIKTAIEPFQLEANKEYLITYNGNDWYKRNKVDNSDSTYPIASGNISILGYQWIGGSTQTYPTNLSSNYYAGDLSIVFQQMD
ncbi:DUF4082 domain-containing protein [Sphingobacterium hungaricum]|nr:DUF4082 domain-containing protein [Sphingobacterium hungaricum]